MKVEIVAIGTEILIGDIVNTNAQYISRTLSNIGAFVYHQSVVGDNEKRLEDELNNCFKRADVVITTGGLGPTQDDLSKEAAANIFNKEMILDKTSLDSIIKYFERINVSITGNNKKQAYFPKGSIILYNDNGTAPGLILEENNKVLIMLPGPPKEMIPMFKKSVLPYLKTKTNTILISKTLKTIGIGESGLEEKLLDIINTQTNPTIATYAKEDDVQIRITATSDNEIKAKTLIENMKNLIHDRIGEYIYGEDDENLESIVANSILLKGLTISTAESCTGGLLAGKLINYPGISSAFNEGFITYSNEAKIKHLNVPKDILMKHGAVSSQTAKEMALGVAINTKSNIGISVTGIAGPDGGTTEKPVGLVYVGVSINGNVSTIKLNLTGDRQKIRNKTVVLALDFLRKQLEYTK